MTKISNTIAITNNNPIYLGTDKINGGMILHAPSNNKDVIFIGNDGNDSINSNAGYYLDPGNTIELDYVSYLNNIYVSGIAGDKLSWIVTSVTGGSIVIIPPPVIEDAYYVSSKGLDTNDGKTPATSWKTIGKVNSTTLSPNKLLLNCGDEWPENIIPKTGMYIGKYGTGPNPRFKGSTKVNTWNRTNLGTTVLPTNCWRTAYTNSPGYGPVWFLNNDGKTYWGKQKTSLTSLTNEYDWFWMNGSLVIYCPNDPNTRYSGVEIATRKNGVAGGSGVKNVAIDGIEVCFTKENGINGGRSDCDNWIVKNNTIHHCGIVANYLGYAGLSSGIYTEATGWLIENNDVWECGSHGIHILTNGAEVKDWIIRKNRVRNCYHSGMDTKDISNGSGHIYNGIIEYNFVSSDADYYAKDQGQNNYFCQADNASGCHHIIYRYNISKNPWGAHFEAGNYTDNISMIHNTLYGINPLYPYSGAITSFAPGYDVEGTNNPTNIIVRDNIGMNCPKHGDLYYNTKNSFLQVDYNCFWDSGSGIVVDVSGYPLYHNNDFISYKLEQGFGAKDKWQDPMFVDPDNGDFHLKVGSPCISAASDGGNIGAL